MLFLGIGYPSITGWID